MNEVENTPVDNDTFSLDLEDFKLDETAEETVEPIQEEVGTSTETEEKEVDYKPLFDALSGKIKYMDEEVKVESIDDLITNYQKGLDYDRKTKKIEELESSEEMSYIKEKAKEAGLTPTEYIKAIKGYEEQQAKQERENEINRLIEEDGVSERAARRMVEAEEKAANAEKIAKEAMADREAAKAELEAKNKREAENNDFLKAYPDVDITSIPKEVYIEAEKIGLTNAYSKYENAKLKAELDILRKNQQNEKSSPVTSTTEHGSKDIETDDFLRGLLGK